MNTAGAVVLALVLLLLAAGAGWIIFTRIRASRLGLPPPPLKSYIPFLKSSSSSSSAAPYAGPSPAPGGLVGWINDRIRLFRYRNARTAAGAYEGTSPYSSSSAAATAGYSGGYASSAGAERGGIAGRGGGAGGARGFAPLDDDDDAVWDSRVGAYHPYEEERELGLVPPSTAHGYAHGHGQGYVPDGEGYQMNLPVEVTPADASTSAEATGGGGGGGVRVQGAGKDDEEDNRGRTRSRSPGPAPSTTAKADPFGDDAEPSNISLRGVSPRPMETASFAARKAARGEEDRRSVFREDV